MTLCKTAFFVSSLFIAAISITTSANAQPTATADISVNICTPTTVSKESDLEFMNISNESGSADASRYANNSRATRARKRHLTAEKVIEASFTISGIADYVYDVTIPSQVTVAAKNSQRLTIGTEECSVSGNHVLTSRGKDSISIKGRVMSDTSDAITFNDDVPNGLPVIINNN